MSLGNGGKRRARKERGGKVNFSPGGMKVVVEELEKRNREHVGTNNFVRDVRKEGGRTGVRVKRANG